MPAASGAHVRQDGARDVQQAEDIGFVQAPHFIGTGFFHRAQQTVTGVVYQHVDASEVLDGSLGDRNALCFVGDVEGDGQQTGLIAKTLSDAAGIPGGGNHGVTVGQCSGGDFCADTARSARDEPDTFEGVGRGHERIPCLQWG